MAASSSVASAGSARDHGHHSHLQQGADLPRAPPRRSPLAARRALRQIRAAVEEFWNDLKRAHYIDHATRGMMITIPFRSNFLGVRSRATFLFEVTGTGAILPSYDMEARVEKQDNLAQTRIFVW